MSKQIWDLNKKEGYWISNLMTGSGDAGQSHNITQKIGRWLNGKKAQEPNNDISEEEKALMRSQTGLIEGQIGETNAEMAERNALRGHRFGLMGLDESGNQLSEIELKKRMNPLERSENELAKIKFNNLYAALNGEYESPELQNDIDRMTGVIMGLKGMSFEQAQGYLKDHVGALRDDANNLQLSEGTGTYLNQMDRMRAERENKVNNMNSYLNRRSAEGGVFGNLIAGYGAAQEPYQQYRDLNRQAYWATRQNQANAKSGRYQLAGTVAGTAGTIAIAV